MAFRQIKFISQELDKDYVFPSISEVVQEADTQLPSEIEEAFSLALTVNIDYNVGAGEGVTAVGAFEMVPSISATILQSVNVGGSFAISANANISEATFAQENEQSSLLVPSASASISYQVTKFDCAPAGQLQSTFCSGTTLYGVYTDGSCGTYNQVIETNSASCGYTPPSLSDPQWDTQGQQVGQTSLTVSYYNPNTVSATLNVDWGDGQNQIGSDNVGIGAQSYATVTASSLNPGTTYNFFADLTKSGYTGSGTISNSLSTDAALTKVWSPIGAQGSYDLTYNYGNVNGCPTYSQALSQVETSYPAEEQTVGTTINVQAFDLDTFTSCTQYQFKVIEE